MFERVLVPLDGTAASEGVLPWVERFIDRHNCRLTLLRVIPPVPAWPGVDYARLAEEDRQEARSYLESLAGRLERDSVPTRARLLGGPEVDMILKAAREERATMIAMTTHGRKGFSRWTMGSVAERVVRASPVPVLLLRSPYEGVAPAPREAGVRRILWPVAADDRAEAALPFVTSLARRLDAEIEVLHVQPELAPPVFAQPGSPTVAFPPAAPERVTLPMVERLTSAGFRVRSSAARGDVASRILDVARAGPVGLIAMSTHGRSGMSRWVLGSVTEKVLRASTVPMVVVRAAARKAVAAA